MTAITTRVSVDVSLGCSGWMMAMYLTARQILINVKALGSHFFILQKNWQISPFCGKWLVFNKLQVRETRTELVS